MNGNGSILASPLLLAAERRSQPQQIADVRAQLLELQGRHSALVQQAALDSQAIHDEAAQLRAECSDDSERLWAVINEHDQIYRARPLTFMARLRWLVTGR